MSRARSISSLDSSSTHVTGIRLEDFDISGSKMFPVHVKSSLHLLSRFQFNPCLASRSSPLVLLQHNRLVANSLKELLHVLLSGLPRQTSELNTISRAASTSVVLKGTSS